jgi:hypothetical protein
MLKSKAPKNVVENPVWSKADFKNAVHPNGVT